MDAEKAIRMIDEYLAEPNSIHRVWLECLTLCRDALEKQIPKKPDLEGDGYDENGELIYDTGYCPNCHHEFEVYYDATKHCPECGQALDWSDIDGEL